jgi:hypothetical protein
MVFFIIIFCCTIVINFFFFNKNLKMKLLILFILYIAIYVLSCLVDKKKYRIEEFYKGLYIRFCTYLFVFILLVLESTPYPTRGLGKVSGSGILCETKVK